MSRLVELGLTFLADPGHRAIAARTLTIAQAAVRGNQDPERVLAALNRLEPASPAGEVDPDRTVAEVLDRWPATLGVFLRNGFTPLADPALRQRLAPTVTVRQAAERQGIALERLLAELQAAASETAPSPEARSER